MFITMFTTVHCCSYADSYKSILHFTPRFYKEDWQWIF